MTLMLSKAQYKNALNILFSKHSPLIKKCHWFPDYKPGNYPQTEAERVEAAKKYNLLPEEYEPLKDDGTGAGDYPNLPVESPHMRDPYYNWDYPGLRRDFMEPFPDNGVLCLPEYSLPDPSVEYGKMYLWFFSAVGLVASILYFLSKFQMNPYFTAKQLPYKGATHYTFELDYNNSQMDKPESISTQNPKVKK